MTKATIKGGGSVPLTDVQHADSSPSEQMVKLANGIAYETDVRGRRLGVVKPNAITRFRLFRILGKDAGNEQMVGNAMLACLVREIDGQPVAPPNSYREIEVLIERLDDDGFAAVVKALREQFGLMPPDQEEEDETKRNLF